MVRFINDAGCETELNTDNTAVAYSKDIKLAGEILKGAPKWAFPGEGMADPEVRSCTPK